MNEGKISGHRNADSKDSVMNQQYCELSFSHPRLLERCLTESCGILGSGCQSSDDGAYGDERDAVECHEEQVLSRARDFLPAVSAIL